jgi:hypothetical protein
MIKIHEGNQKMVNTAYTNFTNGIEVLDPNNQDGTPYGIMSGTEGITSTVDKTDFQQIISGTKANVNAGTWTTVRTAQGLWVKRHTAASETVIIGFDIDAIIRTTASKGFKLTSFDVVYTIGTLAMNAHTITIDKINYANNTAPTVTSVPVTGTLSTATQAQPYASAITVTTPAFDITTDSKYVVEITANFTATTAYDLAGLVLKYTRNDL